MADYVGLITQLLLLAHLVSEPPGRRPRFQLRVEPGRLGARHQSRQLSPKALAGQAIMAIHTGGTGGVG